MNIFGIGIDIVDRERINKIYTKYGNKFAEKIINSKKSNLLKCIYVKTKKEISFNFTNIFICCGPISSASLLLRSNLVKSDKVIFKESQRFFLPIFNNSFLFSNCSLSREFIFIFCSDI